MRISKLSFFVCFEKVTFRVANLEKLRRHVDYRIGSLLRCYYRFFSTFVLITYTKSRKHRHVWVNGDIDE